MTTDGTGMLVKHEIHETREIGGHVVGSASTSTIVGALFVEATDGIGCDFLGGRSST